MVKRSVLLTALALLLVLAIFGWACRSSSTPAPRPTRTAGPRPTSTDRPVRSPQPSDTPAPLLPTATAEVVPPTPDASLLDKLFEEAYFTPGAGGVECLWRGEEIKSPAISFVSGFRLHDDARTVCLWDFPLDERITVSFYAPNDDLIVAGDFFVNDETVFQIYPGRDKEAVGSILEYDENRYVLGIDIAWSAILPDEGYITAVSTSAYARGSFDVSLPRISVLPSDWEDNREFFGLNDCFDFFPGDTPFLIGTGFVPNSNLPLGIYGGEWGQGVEPGKLVLGEIVNTTDRGGFALEIEIEPSDPAQYYHVLAVTSEPEEGMFCPTEEDGVLNYDACRVGPLACFQVRPPLPQVIPPEFQPYLPTLLSTDIPPVLPPSFPIEAGLPPIYPYIFTLEKYEYELSLDYGEDCQGAGVCHYGSMSGKLIHGTVPVRTRTIPFDLEQARTVGLANGITGYFTEAVCMANCSDATVYWIQNGYQYMVGLKAGREADVVALANAAILNFEP